MLGHYFWLLRGVVLYLFFKASLGAQRFIWKWVFIHMQIKLIYIWKVVHQASLWKRGTRQLWNGLLHQLVHKRRIDWAVFCLMLLGTDPPFQTITGKQDGGVCCQTTGESLVNGVESWRGGVLFVQNLTSLNLLFVDRFKINTVWI